MGGWDLDVGDLTTLDAHQVVVVPGEPLGQFIAGESLGTQVMSDDIGLLQDGQSPVERREGHDVSDHLGQLRRGHRAGGPRQRIDHGLPALGVAHVVVQQMNFNLTIESRFGHIPDPLIMILIAMITVLISIFKSRITTVSILAVLALVACSETGTDDERLSIVATTSIWGDVVTQIVGQDADVDVLIPRNVDAHDYQPTPRQAGSLLDADLVIANGLGLEEGLQDVLDSAVSDGARVIELTPRLDPLPFPGGDSDSLDPHVWFDPQRVALATDLIAAELHSVDDSVDWAARAEAYVAELTAADEEMRGLLSSVPEESRKMVTNHQALGYLANTYDLEIVGVVIPGGSTLADPSSAELAALVDVIEKEDVDVIFNETSLPDRLAEAVAAEVGRDISVVAIYTESLGDPGTPAGSLIGMLIEDARLISEALG